MSLRCTHYTWLTFLSMKIGEYDPTSASHISKIVCRYLSTIDIALDHFGFNLAWGSSVWLPMIYTSQAQYLAHHPTELPWLQAAGLFGAGVIGYAIFRSANNEKFRLRQSRGQCLIWGREPRTLRVTYQTADSSEHSSILLCSGKVAFYHRCVHCMGLIRSISGWWGIVRHPNYVGDLIFSFCTCAGCGFSHILPWSYFLFMASLLIHRCLRDEARCSEKYGESWQAYCKTVRWRLIPWIL